MPHIDHSIQFTFKLRKTLFAYLATALLVLVVALSLALTLTLFGQMKRAEDIAVTHAVETRAMAIGEWCRLAEGLAAQITSRTRIRQELAKFNQAGISLEVLKRFTEPKLKDAMHLSDEIIGILRLDANHRVVAGCGNGNSLPVRLRTAREDASDEVTILEPVAIKNRIVIVVSAPIIDTEGRRQGTDLVMMDSSRLGHIVNDPSAASGTRQVVLGYSSSTGCFPQSTAPTLVHRGPSGRMSFSAPFQKPPPAKPVRKIGPISWPPMPRSWNPPGVW